MGLQNFYFLKVTVSVYLYNNKDSGKIPNSCAILIKKIKSSIGVKVKSLQFGVFIDLIKNSVCLFILCINSRIESKSIILQIAWSRLDAVVYEGPNFDIIVGNLYSGTN